MVMHKRLEFCLMPDLVESLGLDVDKINMSIMGINGSVSKSNQSVTITFKSKYI